MKKFLYVLSIALGTCFAANAQSNQKSEESTTTNVEVKVAGQQVQGENGTVQSANASESKACCSSKKGKSTANAKGCCADGKMSDAHCSDKKGHADAGTKKDNE